MHLFLLSEKFYCPPDDHEYLVQLVVSESAEAALEFGRWSVHGPDTAIFRHWDVFDLGTMDSLNPNLRVVMVGGRINYDIASYGESLSKLPDYELHYREETMHQIEVDGNRLYVEDPTAITNYAYRMPPQLPSEDGTPPLVTRVDLPSICPDDSLLTGVTMKVTVEESVPREKTIYEVIAQELSDTNNAESYGEMLAYIRKTHFSFTPVDGWLERHEQHGDFETTVWENPVWERDIRAHIRSQGLEFEPYSNFSLKGK